MDQPPDAPLNGPHRFHVNNAGMVLIRDELEAQGVGAYEPEGVRNHPIDLNKLIYNDRQVISWGECSTIVTAAKREPVLGAEHEDITPETVDDWVRLWQSFLDFLATAADHDGFRVT